MEAQKLREIILQTIAEVIAEQVAQKLTQKLSAVPDHRVLAVFTGSSIAIAPALESLKKLKDDGYSFTLAFSDVANQLLDIPRILHTLVPEKVISGVNGMPESFVMDFQTVIVPTMTINTASKLAYCMADTLATRIISQAYMKGKRVVAAIDGCCPDNGDRILKGYNMTEALKQELRLHIEKLRGYGIQFTTAKNLYYKTKGYSEKKQDLSVHLQQSVISRVDVLNNKMNKVIYVSERACITRLASEAAESLGISIIRS